MSKILKFDMFEKVEQDFFKRNPKFYITKSEQKLKDLKRDIKTRSDQDDEYISQLKKTKLDDIIFYVEPNQNGDYYKIKEPLFLKNTDNLIRLYEGVINIRMFIDTEYNYKIILQFINFMNPDTIILKGIEKNIINYLFTYLNDYYGLYYTVHSFKYLFITKNIEEYKKKINEVRSNSNSKILYYNNKTKGKVLTDFDSIEIENIKNKLKNISIDDIFFNNKSKRENEYMYEVQFKDKRLTDDVKKYNLIDPIFFTRENDSTKVYFGHLKNRYHTGRINYKIQGIGFGYKLYKSFLKFNGYMISDEQSSMDARKIYLNLMKDDDVYVIVDRKTKNMGNYNINKPDVPKVMVIWKKYPKLEQLLKIIRTHELRNNRKYIYDNELLKYMKDKKIIE